MSATKRLILSLSLGLLGWGLAIVFSRFLYAAWFGNVYFMVVLLCALIVHGRLRPFLSDAILVVLSAALFVSFQFAFLHLPPRWVQSLSALGFSSFMLLGFRAIWVKDPKQTPLAAGFIGTALLISLYLISMPALTLVGQLHPKVLDLYLYSFDASLHLQPSFLLGAAFFKWPLLKATAQAFYVGLPVSLALVFAGQLVVHRKRAVEAICAFFIGGPLGVFAYNFFPALGPRYVFRLDFPLHPLSLGQAARVLVEPIPVQGFVNAMPSMHMVWVLLAWWYSRGLPWMYRAVATAFVALTVLATLGSGEHYMVDLIVAFPFALLLQSLCAFSLPMRDERRIRGLALGFLATTLWFVLLRFENRLFWVSPLIPWLLALATIAAVLYVHAGIELASGVPPLQIDSVALSPVPRETLDSGAGASPERMGVMDAAK